MQDFTEINTNYISLLIQSALAYDARFNTYYVTVAVPRYPRYYVKFWNLKRTNQIVFETAPSRIFDRQINLTVREYRKLEAMGWKKKWFSTVYTNKVAIKNEDHAGVMAMELYTILVNVFGHESTEPLNINSYLEFNFSYIFVFDTITNFKKIYYDTKYNLKALYKEALEAPATQTLISKSVRYSKALSKKIHLIKNKYFK